MEGAREWLREPLRAAGPVGGITGFVGPATAAAGGVVPFGYEATVRLATFEGVDEDGVEGAEDGCEVACVTGVEVPEDDVFPTACIETMSETT